MAESAAGARGECAVCEGATAPALAVGNFEIFECASCRHRMLHDDVPAGHLRATFGDAYFTEGAAGYPDYLAEERLLRDRGRRYARLIGSYRERPGTLLDLGAAAGFTLRAFGEQGWHGVGVEPNDRMASHARRSGLDVRTATLEDFDSAGRFDLVCVLQLIAHLVEPRVAMAKIADLVASGGLLLIETWDWRSRTARLLGSRWHQYSPPSVRHWYSSGSLRLLAARHRFREIASGRAFKRLSWDHARSLIAFKLRESMLERPFGAVSRLIPGRLALPYPFDDARWYLFQSATDPAIDPSPPDRTVT